MPPAAPSSVIRNDLPRGRPAARGRDRAGILSRLAVALGRADLKIERQSRSELEADRVSFVFNVTGSQPPATLSQTLQGIPHVLEVTIEGEGRTAEPVAARTDAARPPQNHVDELVRSYPNLVSGVREAQGRLSLDDAGWHDLGLRVGAGLIAAGTVKPVRTDSLPFGLERLVLPAIKAFSIAKVTGDTLSITVNPFAQGVSSPTVHCHFLAGLISGLLQSALPTATATERTCKAVGDAACTFVVTAR